MTHLRPPARLRVLVVLVVLVVSVKRLSTSCILHLCCYEYRGIVVISAYDRLTASLTPPVPTTAAHSLIRVPPTPTTGPTA
jgi:hypothetical protein